MTVRTGSSWLIICANAKRELTLLMKAAKIVLEDATLAKMILLAMSAMLLTTTSSIKMTKLVYAMTAKTMSTIQTKLNAFVKKATNNLTVPVLNA